MHRVSRKADKFVVWRQLASLKQTAARRVSHPHQYVVWLWKLASYRCPVVYPGVSGESFSYYITLRSRVPAALQKKQLAKGSLTERRIRFPVLRYLLLCQGVIRSESCWLVFLALAYTTPAQIGKHGKLQPAGGDDSVFAGTTSALGR
ncbi:hypothetical protein M513_07198 [Trichuris suis]|uniref:Uncharacterized protein n=1 Tax=Trichuris suis TaxID=68888 RepID=A0A085M3S3_9BILA|nr:hypothetical protein M513_07198 [Trichuris suis]